ncbi:MAG: 30S ribosomal protein S5 [Planctomycetota bacterium]
MARSRSRRQDSGSELMENVVKVFRCAAVVKGGRRFSFAALVVVGDGKGRVGYGYGKANDVPGAVDKAFTEARATLRTIPLAGDTIPHKVMGRYESTRVLLRPAGPGTGVIAGAAVRAVVECCGIRDVLIKVFNSRNPKNIVKATMNGLLSLRDKEAIERLRGVTIE